MSINHYNWLYNNFYSFLELIGSKEISWNGGLIGAHGDKCYSYKWTWEEAGIPFHHGAAIFLMSYMREFNREIRDERHKVDQWVIKEYPKYKEILELFSDEGYE